ncbi:eukaryotic initiation factor 3 gamma subunit [Gregarina niphandrodes]|uniref:tRNA (adenine(58)-N(1))-methyltransferase non-catalytic subunit TRM6 n=1 Tax=Gregarina niphandrodes TaxID=110365 RepID=A0A023B863_GRENI|nr:eukaryotic initiation factor 3 gamma subunit [Gregarina niphandrodes]EZG68217.1 eukaryotic initiation factor 3 gamma subunit [Gregarina niphandrodes]|eukprot:XP_011130019.1 eukaryotic initiation factor 3 gamma subunit [Gregarina niphandrodes]
MTDSLVRAPETPTDDAIVSLGSWVILTELASKTSRIEFLDPVNKEVRFLRKWNIPYSCLLGIPYGATLTLDHEGKWRRCRRLNIDAFVAETLAELRRQGVDMGSEDEESEDEGAPLVPTGSQGSQKLQTDDVISMKSDKVSLRELIIGLCKGSGTFRRRTAFSQEKYIRKKLDRHVLQVGIKKCDSQNIWDAYASAWKLGGLDSHYAGYLLNQANITAGQNVLVFDHSLGFLTACVLDRLGTLGKLIFAAEFRGASSHIMKQTNLTTEIKSCYREIPFDVLIEGCRRGFNDEKLREDFRGFFYGAENLEKSLEKPELSEYHLDRVRLAIQRRDLRLANRLACYKMVEKQQIDSCVAVLDCSRLPASNPILTANTLSDIYQIAEKTLKPGGRLVIFHTNMQPLSDLYAHIKARKHTWTNCSFSEICSRSICFLPQRSHPQMDNSIRLVEGFILCASKMVLTEINPTPLDGHEPPSGQEPPSKKQKNEDC